MAKLDEIKEILNTLRIWLSLIIGLIVVVSSGLISRYDMGQIDWLFWAGTGFLFSLLIAMLLIIAKIASRTKEIKDL